jgi:hypothetical protein
MSALPESPSVPLWIKDEQWDVWHAWPTGRRLAADGTSRTACGDDWTWWHTLKTSYHVAELAGCYLCRLALEDTPVRRRGRPRRLPAGPKRPPGRPGRPPGPRPGRPTTGRLSVLDEALEPLEPRRPKQTRQERAVAQGAKLKSYTTPTGGTSVRAVVNAAQKAALAAEDVAWAGTFEVGAKVYGSPCPFCGQTNMGSAFCGAWCLREWNRGQQEEKFERSGRRMARRQFLDQLYGHKRRDTISSWTPPRAQTRSHDDEKTKADRALLAQAIRYV